MQHESRIQCYARVNFQTAIVVAQSIRLSLRNTQGGSIAHIGTTTTFFEQRMLPFKEDVLKCACVSNLEKARLFSEITTQQWQEGNSGNLSWFMREILKIEAVKAYGAIQQCLSKNVNSEDRYLVVPTTC